MPSYIVTQQAQQDIEEILIGVMEFTGFEESALKLDQAFHRKFELLAEFPYMGVNRNDGTRETFVNSYRIVYDILPSGVRIIAVIHSRRLYPRP